MEPFEYAIKKDVRNNPIVREVDEARERDSVHGRAGGLLVILLLGSAWQHHQLLRHGYEIEQINQERAVEEEAGHQLRLEIDTLRSPKRIEALAIVASASWLPLPTKPSCSKRCPAGRSAGQICHRRALMSDPGIPVARHARSGGFSSPPDSWRCGSAPSRRGSSTCRSSGTRISRRGPHDNSRTRFRRRPSAATSSIAAAIFSRPASTSIPSTPCRPRSTTAPRRSPSYAARSATAAIGPPTAPRGRRGRP